MSEIVEYFSGCEALEGLLPEAEKEYDYYGKKKTATELLSLIAQLKCLSAIRANIRGEKKEYDIFALMKEIYESVPNFEEILTLNDEEGKNKLMSELRGLKDVSEKIQQTIEIARRKRLIHVSASLSKAESRVFVEGKGCIGATSIHWQTNTGEGINVNDRELICNLFNDFLNNLEERMRELEKELGEDQIFDLTER